MLHVYSTSAPPEVVAHQLAAEALDEFGARFYLGRSED